MASFNYFLSSIDILICLYFIASMLIIGFLAWLEHLLESGPPGPKRVPHGRPVKQTNKPCISNRGVRGELALTLNLSRNGWDANTPRMPSRPNLPYLYHSSHVETFKSQYRICGYSVKSETKRQGYGVARIQSMMRLLKNPPNSGKIELSNAFFLEKTPPPSK